MAKDRKTLTDADIVSHRSNHGRIVQEAPTDVDTPRAKSDKDTGATPPPRKPVKDRDTKA